MNGSSKYFIWLECNLKIFTDGLHELYSHQVINKLQIYQEISGISALRWFERPLLQLNKQNPN